jgi:hypothetical protein
MSQIRRENMKGLTRILTVGLMLGLACGAQAAPSHFLLPLTGAQEVPGPGDPDGTGTASLLIDPDALTIDWDIVVSDIDFPLTGAHIHVGAAGVAGPIVVDFDSQLTGSGLVDADLADILANPTNYYVNVHNGLFPAGAIRGQLPCPTVIPDPATLTLAMIGLASLGLRRRIRM